MDLDRRLAQLAARQHGLITKEQAKHLGATSRQIRWRISAGVLTVVRRNVYRFAGVPPTWHQSVLAAARRRSAPDLDRVVDDLLRRRLVRLPQIAQCAIG